MDSVYDLWRQITPLLHEEIGDTAYDVWIKPAKPVEMTANDFVIKVDSTISRDIVISRFTEPIKRIIKELIGIELNVRIVVEEDIVNLQFLPTEFADSGYEYTFDTFIVGSTNRFAHAAAMAVAQNPGSAYNPLFIYGPPGLGKTHLMFAIRDYILRRNPKMNIMYTKGDQFTNELIESLQKAQQMQFRQKYRMADVLLVDDIQFIGGKTSTEEEFFHTFNELYQDHKQIVLTSDRPPKEIKTLTDRLRNRFESGLLADVQPPEFETRVAIIKRKAAQFSLDMPDATAEFIASKIKSNIRQLEGVVKKMNIICMMEKEKPSIPTAKNVIKDILSDEPSSVYTFDKIIEEVARAFEVTSDDIYSNRRSQPITAARQAAMYCVRETISMTYDEIGNKFGGKDHTTVIYSIQKVEAKMKKQPDFKATVEDIIKNIKQ